MAISEAYARELAKQASRKEKLKAVLEEDLAGCTSILFEAGCGHGHWLTDYAKVHPDTVCVGIDLISRRIRKGNQKKVKWGLENLYFYKAELGEFIKVLPAGIALVRTVLLFPDNWPKVRHHRRRMVQSAFLDELALRSPTGAEFCFRSDDPLYYEWTMELLNANRNWEINDSVDWPHESETYFQSLMERYYSVIAQRV